MGWMEEEEAVGTRCCELGVRWVGGWVDERTCVATQAGADGKAAVDEETEGAEWGGGLVGWVDGLVLVRWVGWVGGGVGGWGLTSLRSLSYMVGERPWMDVSSSSSAAAVSGAAASLVGLARVSAGGVGWVLPRSAGEGLLLFLLVAYNTEEEEDEEEEEDLIREAGAPGNRKAWDSKGSTRRRRRRRRRRGRLRRCMGRPAAPAGTTVIVRLCVDEVDEVDGDDVGRSMGAASQKIPTCVAICRRSRPPERAPRHRRGRQG